MWNGLGYLPRHSGSSTWAILFHLVGSGSLHVEDAAVVFPEVVHHAQELAVGREADLVARREDLVEHDLPVVVVDPSTGYWSGESLLNCRKATGSKFFSGSRMRCRRTAARRSPPSGLRMPDRAVGAGQRKRRIAGHRAFLDEQLAHRHHFPVDLVALGAAVVVLSGLRVGIDLRDRERAALLPAVAQIGRVGRPVELQRRLHPRRRAVEAGGDVLLPVGHEIGLGILGIDGDVDAESEPRGLGDVLDQLHLRAVVAHAIDVGAWFRRLHPGRWMP